MKSISSLLIALLITACGQPNSPVVDAGSADAGPADAGSPEPFDITEKSIVELQQAMQAGILTSEELVEEYLQRMDAYEEAGPAINSMISMNPDALDEARALDQERELQGPRGPMHGIPLVVKDSIDAQGLATTNGSLSLLNFFPVDDSFVVGRLREAGAIILGKANQDELQFGGWGLSSSGGQTLNPYQPECTPSGSSGGTGAAVAANFAAAGIGADHAGSIRNPAAANNLYGIRPTLGLISREGAWSGSRYINVIGPMVRSPEDLAAILDAVSGHDPADRFTAASIGKLPESYMDSLEQDGLTGKKIGYVADRFDPEKFPKPDYFEAVSLSKSALEIMEAGGANLVPFGLEQVVTGMEYEALNVLGRDKLDSLNEYFRSNPVTDIAGYCDFVVTGNHYSAFPGYFTVAAIVNLWSTCVLPPPTEQDRQEAELKQAKIHDAILEFMDAEQLDAIVVDGTTGKLMPISWIWEGFPEPSEEWQEFADEGNQLVAMSSASGFPVLTVPAGLTQDGHPISLQVMGRPFSEPYLISLAQSFAKAYQQHMGSNNRVLPPTTPAL